MKSYQHKFITYSIRFLSSILHSEFVERCGLFFDIIAILRFRLLLNDQRKSKIIDCSGFACSIFALSLVELDRSSLHVCLFICTLQQFEVNDFN